MLQRSPFFCGAQHVHPTRDAVRSHNYTTLRDFGKPVIKIHALNSSEQFKHVDLHDAGYLENVLLLSYDVRVMLTYNMDAAEGLINGTMGTVHFILWDDGVQDPFETPPAMVLVEFDQYRGLGGYDDHGRWLVPVKQRTHQIELKDQTGQRRQFPLALGFAITEHKSQGITLSD